MKRISVLLASAALLFAAVSCVDLGPVETRLDKLESQVSSIQTLVDAMNKKVYVSSVKQIEGGYVINFTDGTTATIKDGAKGEVGPQGPAGADGDAYFSSFEMKDGKIYITLNDENKTEIVLVLASESFVSQIKSVSALAVECDYGDLLAVVKVSPSSLAEKITAENVKVNLYEFNAKAEVVAVKEIPFETVSVANGVVRIKGFVEDPSAIYDFETGATAAMATVTVFDAADEFESSMVEAGFYGDPYVEYAGEKYRVKRMADGMVWFTENLRYVPEGMTPSNSLTDVTAGVYYPVVLNEGKTAAVFSTDPKDIKANGYLYQSEVALGLKVGDITTVEEAMSYEYTQGICPEGWHIPTVNEIVSLVGKATSPIETWENAPYYDKVKKNASMALLNEDGFNANAWGAVSIVDNTKTSATLMGYLKTYPTAVASGYICGSSYAGVSYNTKDVPESGIKNIQFWGFMPMANNGTFNGAKLSYRIGASVRCVR